MAGWLTAAEQDPSHLVADAPESDSAAAEWTTADSATAGATGPRRKDSRRGRTTGRVFTPGESAVAASQGGGGDGAVSAGAQTSAAAMAAVDATAESVGSAQAAMARSATAAEAAARAADANKLAQADDENGIPTATAIAAPTTTPWTTPSAAAGTPQALVPSDGGVSAPTTAGVSPTATAAQPTPSPATAAATAPDNGAAAADPAGDTTPSPAAATPAAGASTSLPSADWVRTADVLDTLAQLAALYGTGDGGTPDYAGAPSMFQTPSGQSAASTAEIEQALYQENQAAAYNGLDAALTGYLNGLAGDNADYRAEVQQIITGVNTQLNALGADALTPSGQQEVRQLILAAALAHAQQIFDDSRSSTAATQQELNQLTQVYLDALAPTPPDTPVSGTVQQWIDEAMAILEQQGYPAGALNPNALAIIISHESSGNPYATNLSDSNAAAGDPSKGLMQTISTTFDEYALPGHTDIWNPVDNIIAGTRYAISRYGSLDNVPGVAAVENGGSYVGY